MKVTLVSMPWQTFEMPAMPLGVLAAHVGQARPDVEVEQVYGTTAWAQFANVESRGAIGLEDYLQVANEGVYTGVGEWIFTSALYPGENWPLERFAACCERNVVDEYPHLLEMWALAPAFIDGLATKILDGGPTFVGLSSTFSQNVPSLALARCLKAKQPNLPIIMGGANCDGPMGGALLRCFNYLDFICRGEGEHTLVEFIDLLREHEKSDWTEGLAAIDGLGWRSPDGTVVINPSRAARVNLREAAPPDFEPYFSDLKARNISQRVRKRIPYEASRGCWWGAAHHCTFCGLNATSMAYRSKDADQVFADIEHLCRKHRSLDIIFVDNIFDLEYFNSLVPRLAEAPWDLRMFSEIKSNVKEQQVAALAAAHVTALQPGIESLSTDILKMMRKGVDSAHNIIFLRSAEENSISAYWSILYGFPDETEEQYERVIEQIPNLYHLQPPDKSRITLQRFSPNFDDTSLGFHMRRPASMYRHLFDLPDGDLMDIAFFHHCENLGIGGETETRLLEAIKQWKAAYPNSTLTMSEEDGALVVRDRRQLRDHADYEFLVPWQVDLIRSARGSRTLAKLTSLAASDFSVDADSVAEFVAYLVKIGLLFIDQRDDGSTTRYVALPVATKASRRPEAVRTPVVANA
ncbi:MAG: RiPP maturation radical SAM C-methyltransferase, partial [Frankiaceae bacterium]|nr:RiPP maturation radical SAM C-methyltransferase [Frankiaceae bacterium]